MRDPRFVAEHRGGPLSREHHEQLIRWAADCAERILVHFERSQSNDRPRQAIAIARKWAGGKVKTGVAMKASVAAHAAARAATDPAAVAAARAAAQAVATAHFADHSMGALLYALKAIEASGSDATGELESQLAKLPPELHAPVSEGIAARLRPLGIHCRQIDGQ